MLATGMDNGRSVRILEVTERAVQAGNRSSRKRRPIKKNRRYERHKPLTEKGKGEISRYYVESTTTVGRKRQNERYLHSLRISRGESYSPSRSHTEMMYGE